MRKLLKIILGTLGVIALGIGLLVIMFNVSMKPDAEREEQISKEAELYLEENFSDNFEVYDTLYDNMGNFEFEYAAKTRDVQNNIDFLVYQDSETDQMRDTYVSSKWSNDLEQAIQAYVVQFFGNDTELHVFIDDEIGKDLNIDPLNPGSYKDNNLDPVIRLTLPRESDDQDEKLFTDFIAYLKNEEILQQGKLIVSYVAKTGEILEDYEWSKEF